jgi:hypothetical protein
MTHLLVSLATLSVIFTSLIICYSSFRERIKTFVKTAEIPPDNQSGGLIFKKRDALGGVSAFRLHIISFAVLMSAACYSQIKFMFT